jgi:Tfp pilus assembly protein PilN
MIEINLLPLELREKRIISFEEIFKAKIIFSVLACLLLFHLFLYTLNIISKKKLDIIEGNWQQLSSKREKIKQLNSELTKLNEKAPLIEQLISKRLLWSQTLNRISDLIVNGVWLSELRFDKQKTEGGEFLEYLTIHGSAASRTKDEPALIGRFMQNLKEDSVFSANFPEVELGPIQKRLINQTEIMDFVLICRLKRQGM